MDLYLMPPVVVPLLGGDQQNLIQRQLFLEVFKPFRRHIQEYMSSEIQLNHSISHEDAFKKPERHPLFKLKLTKKVQGQEEPIEFYLVDPHSDQLVTISELTKITAVFRDDHFKPIYQQYYKVLQNMQVADLEMPENERFFAKFDHPFGCGPKCSGCGRHPRLIHRSLTQFPHYLTIFINRESRISGVRAFSKRIVELPTQPSVKIFGQRYGLTTVVCRQVLMKGGNTGFGPKAEVKVTLKVLTWSSHFAKVVMDALGVRR